MSDPACCYVCDKIEVELRPYGPKGEWICFDCAMAPHRKEQTEVSYRAQLEAAGSSGLIGEETGPRPLTRKPS